MSDTNKNDNLPTTTTENHDMTELAAETMESLTSGGLSEHTTTETPTEPEKDEK